MKVVILGSRRELEPLEFLYIPKTQENAKQLCEEAIRKADEVWIYTDGAGSDTLEDVYYAFSKNKPIKVIQNKMRDSK